MDSHMIEDLDEMPSYIEQEVRDRIAAGADGSTLIVDEAEEEFIVAYSGFTRALDREYEKACDERGKDVIKVYQLSIDSSGIQLSRYESAEGKTAEQTWRESVS